MGTTLPIDDSERISWGAGVPNADAAARWAEERRGAGLASYTRASVRSTHGGHPCPASTSA